MGPDTESCDGRYASRLRDNPPAPGRYVVRFRGKRGCVSAPHFNDWDGRRWKYDHLPVARWQAIEI